MTHGWGSLRLGADLVSCRNPRPGKYSGLVFFDRWGGCILYSGVYLMYISEDVKESLREYDGQAIEIDALEVIQPINPGDGLIERFNVIGPAHPKQTGYTVEGTKLEAQPIAIHPPFRHLDAHHHECRERRHKDQQLRNRLRPSG